MDTPNNQYHLSLKQLTVLICSFFFHHLIHGFHWSLASLTFYTSIWVNRSYSAAVAVLPKYIPVLGSETRISNLCQKLAVLGSETRISGKWKFPSTPGCQLSYLTGLVKLLGSQDSQQSQRADVISRPPKYYPSNGGGGGSGVWGGRRVNGRQRFLFSFLILVTRK